MNLIILNMFGLQSFWFRVHISRNFETSRQCSADFLKFFLKVCILPYFSNRMSSDLSVSELLCVVKVEDSLVIAGWT